MTHKPLVAYLVLVAIAVPCSTAGSDPKVEQAKPAATTPSRPAVVMSALEREAEQIPMLDDRDQAVWLGEGEARFLAVRRTSVLREVAGVMVLVRNRGVGADAQDRIGYLRRALPRVGWDTLTIDLPDPRDTAPPARERERSAPISPGARDGRATGASDTAAATTANAAPPAPPPPVDTAERDRVLARLSAAVTEAARDGRRVIMVGEGEAAAWVARANGATPLARATIVFNIDAPESPLDGQPMSRWVQSQTVPSLLMQEAPRAWSPDVRLPDGTDLLLLPPTRPAGEERLVRTVRSWLKRRDLV